MGKKATKAADNVYCIARYKAAEEESRFNSRESTAELMGMDRIALKALGSLQNTDELREKLIQIAADGVISEDEHDDFNQILEELQRISMNAQALQLWADKHIELIHNREENQNERK